MRVIYTSMIIAYILFCCTGCIPCSRPVPQEMPENFDDTIFVDPTIADIPQLIEFLKADNYLIAYKSTMALKKLGSQAENAAVPLTDALRTGHMLVRAGAASALGHINGDPDIVIEPLIEALNDPWYPVRKRAALSLGNYGAEAIIALPELRRIASSDPFTCDGVYLVRVAAIDAISRIEE